MAENGTNKKAAKAKPQAQEPGVLASLPSTRPERFSRRSRTGSTPASSATATKAKPKAKTAKKAPKRKPAAAPKAAPKTPQPVASVTEAARSRPQPVRAGSHRLAKPAAKSAARRAPAPPKPPSGTELVTTVVQAAGELAQVGLTVTGQIIKRAVEKLPKV